MASAQAHSQSNKTKVILVVLCALVVCACVAVFSASQAQGSAEENALTMGIGSDQASVDRNLSTSDRLDPSANASLMGEDGFMIVSEASANDSSDLSSTKQRSITVKDPDPVVVPVAVDTGNQEAVNKANEVCTLNPLPTAPHVAPNVNDGTWLCGSASAYCVATNDDGSGNFGVTSTASGRALSDYGITVAVPESQSYLIGRVVELCYDGKVVIATVTDTGGFAQYGRSLDLAPGVISAFGVSSVNSWGVRNVYYRFL